MSPAPDHEPGYQPPTGSAVDQQPAPNQAVVELKGRLDSALDDNPHVVVTATGSRVGYFRDRDDAKTISIICEDLNHPARASYLKQAETQEGLSPTAIEARRSRQALIRVVEDDTIGTGGDYQQTLYTIIQLPDGALHIDKMPFTAQRGDGQLLLPQLTEQEKLTERRLAETEDKTELARRFLAARQRKEAVRQEAIRKAGGAIVTEREVDQLQFELMGARPVNRAGIPI
jgi:hypothetical protein